MSCPLSHTCARTGAPLILISARLNSCLNPPPPGRQVDIRRPLCDKGSGPGASILEQHRDAGLLVTERSLLRTRTTWSQLKASRCEHVLLLRN